MLISKEPYRASLTEMSTGKRQFSQHVVSYDRILEERDHQGQILLMMLEIMSNDVVCIPSKEGSHSLRWWGYK